MPFCWFMCFMLSHYALYMLNNAIIRFPFDYLNMEKLWSSCFAYWGSSFCFPTLQGPVHHHSWPRPHRLVAPELAGERHQGELNHSDDIYIKLLQCNHTTPALGLDITMLPAFMQKCTVGICLSFRTTGNDIYGATLGYSLNDNSLCL